MREVINFFKALNGHVRINLGGRQTGVSEQLLDTAKICTGIEQMRSKTVPQGVRGQSGIQTGIAKILLLFSFNKAAGSAFCCST